MGDPRAVAERWTRALSEHDLEAAVSCFDPDYADEAPARRGESVRGQEHVRRNFEALFLDVPDPRAEILSSAVDGDAVCVGVWVQIGQVLKTPRVHAPEELHEFLGRLRRLPAIAPGTGGNDVADDVEAAPLLSGRTAPTR